MVAAQLDQFNQVLTAKLVPVLILGAILIVLVGLPLYWFRLKVERGGIRAIRSARARRQAQNNVRSTASSDLEPLQLEDSPRCPVCNSLMVQRTARRGEGAGSQFWGCSNYPKCRGTRAI